MGKIIRDYLFPTTCLVCGKTGFWLCKKCKNLYLINHPPECMVCRRISDDFLTHKHCLQDTHIEQVIVLWQYNKLARKIMLTFKRSLKYSIIENLIQIASPTIQRLVTNDSLLLPVPSRPTQLKERGFNQSELIAQQISKYTSTKVLSVFKRLNTSKQQTSKTRQERLNQQRSDFYLPGDTSSKHKIKEKNLIIIDDVCTTGTTLNNCARLLKKFQPKTIKALALFRGTKPSEVTLSASGASCTASRTTKPT